jgi:hypothetical protein
MPVILALGRLRQEDHKFGASLVYIVNSRSSWFTKQGSVSTNKETNKTPKNSDWRRGSNGKVFA